MNSNAVALLKLDEIDVVSIEKSGEHFRLLYDVKGRFTIHRITAEEATYKLLKVRKVALGARGVPYVVTHDGRTIRYPDPSIKGECVDIFCYTGSYDWTSLQSTTLSSLT